MIKSLWAKITGASILQKAARTTAYTVINFGSSQLIRLLSNLVLTRLLFPEAFGIMALSGLLLTKLPPEVIALPVSELRLEKNAFNRLPDGFALMTAPSAAPASTPAGREV